MWVENVKNAEKSGDESQVRYANNQEAQAKKRWETLAAVEPTISERVVNPKGASKKTYTPKTIEKNGLIYISRNPDGTINYAKSGKLYQRKGNQFYVGGEDNIKAHSLIDFKFGKAEAMTESEYENSKSKSPTPKSEPVATATAKVADQIQTVAKTEGQRPAKEVKSELVSQIEQQIRDAKPESEYLGNETVKAKRMNMQRKVEEVEVPLLEAKDEVKANGTRIFAKQYADALARKAPKVTIDIPGDGTFTVFNTKEALSEMLTRAKRLSTSSTESPKVTYRGISKEDREWIAAEKAKQPQEPTSEIPQGPGARTLQERPEQPESYNATSLKNAVAELEKASAGLPGFSPVERQNMAESWIRSGQTLARNPLAGKELSDKLIANPKRGLTGDESALLLRHKVSIFNALNDAAEKTWTGKNSGEKAEAQTQYAALTDEFNKLLDAINARGSEWGREGRWRQAMAYEDYTMATQERLLRASLGRELTNGERENLMRQIKERDAIIEQQKQLADKRATEAVDATLKRVAAEAKAQPTYHPSIMAAAERIVVGFENRAKLASNRLRDRLSRASAGLDPLILKDVAEIGAAKIARYSLDFAKWSKAMLDEYGPKIKDYLEPGYAAAKQFMEDNLKGVKSEQVKRVVRGTDLNEKKTVIGQQIAKKVADGKRADITNAVQRLARIFVEQGIKTRDGLIDAVHSFLSEIDPTITRRDAMDAISGYGDFRQLSKDQISVQLRDLKGQMQQVSKLEDMQAGQPPLKTGAERRIPSREESKLIQQVNDAKRKFQIPIYDPNTQLRSSLDELKKRMQTRIDDLQEKIDSGDYSRKPAREPIKMDETAIRLQAEKLRVEKKFAEGRRKAELAQRSKWQKGLDAFVKWERAFKLSSPVVFGKLTAAAITRVAETAASETVGGALSKAPIISRIASQAPREGGLNVRAMAHGLTEGIMKGMNDAWQTARHGAANIDVTFGDKIRDKDWANFFGQLHGMMKAPIKRAEFTLSLDKRIQHAIRNGIDVTDPMVQTRLSTEALDDGFRSIFMQHGFSSDMFNQFVGQLEKSKKYPVAGEITARTLRFLMPVVRVPLNIVAETATGVHGIPTASARVMFHAIKGTLDKLPPEIADSIMRQFKKGSIGLGLMAIGYFNSQNIGGYDWRQKRGPKDAKFSGFQVPSLAGIWPVDKDGNIPRWLTHAPWFELMQIGATVHRVKDEHVKGQDKGIGEGMWAAGLGLIEETPFIGQMTRINAVTGAAPSRDRYFGQLAQSTVDPQLLIKVAQMMDTTNGVPVNRKTTTIPDYVKAGIPILREQLPVKR